MKKNHQISSYLQKYAQPFEIEPYLIKQSPLKTIQKLKDGKWKDISKPIKSNIKTLDENSRKKSSRQLFLRIQSILKVIYLAHTKILSTHF